MLSLIRILHSKANPRLPTESRDSRMQWRRRAPKEYHIKSENTRIIISAISIYSIFKRIFITCRLLCAYRFLRVSSELLFF